MHLEMRQIAAGDNRVDKFIRDQAGQATHDAFWQRFGITQREAEKLLAHIWKDE